MRYSIGGNPSSWWSSSRVSIVLISVAVAFPTIPLCMQADRLRLRRVIVENQLIVRLKYNQGTTCRLAFRTVHQVSPLVPGRISIGCKCICAGARSTRTQNRLPVIEFGVKGEKNMCFSWNYWWCWQCILRISVWICGRNKVTMYAVIWFWWDLGVSSIRRVRTPKRFSQSLINFSR